MKNIMLSLLFTAVIGLVGCNTMRGVGQDVQTGGQKLENAADKAQKN